ncbi:DUF3644 domain-containing protein [Methylobacterium sp. CM6244]
MAKRVRNLANKLERWEIALVKKMTQTGRYSDQDIQAYFSRPTRTINHARVGEIRDGSKHAAVNASSIEELNDFLERWPQIDWDTGGHIIGDELVIKAREAIIQAVQGYNNPKAHFKTEMFIVTAVIAWTYLLHYFYKKNAIPYFYSKDGSPLKTKYGATKHWELETCLKHGGCPLSEEVKANLLFLITIRHEIEHQLTNRIDDSFGTILQACALNFNNAIKEIAGPSFGLEKDLSFSLQFSTITRDQRNLLLKQKGLPAHIQAMQIDYESKLAAEMMRDPRYAYKVAFIEVAANRKGGADEAIQFIRAGTPESDAILRVLMKETERQKYKPKQIIEMMQGEGYAEFGAYEHIQLWKELDAQDPKKGFGVSLRPKDWWWYDKWIEKVREHCAATYGRPAREAEVLMPVPAPAAD